MMHKIKLLAFALIVGASTQAMAEYIVFQCVNEDSNKIIFDVDTAKNTIKDNNAIYSFNQTDKEINWKENYNMDGSKYSIWSMDRITLIITQDVYAMGKKFPRNYWKCQMFKRRF